MHRFTVWLYGGSSREQHTEKTTGEPVQCCELGDLNCQTRLVRNLTTCCDPLESACIETNAFLQRNTEKASSLWAAAADPQHSRAASDSCLHKAVSQNFTYSLCLRPTMFLEIIISKWNKNTNTLLLVHISTPCTGIIGPV